MPSYEVRPHCTVEDGRAVAACNAAAFWGEIWWRLLWPGQTLESVTAAIADRTPRNLLQMRGVRRHQTVVDTESGDIVGYARWVLPDSHNGRWLEAQTPDVDATAKDGFKKAFDDAAYEPRDDMDDMDDHLWEWRSKYDREDCLELDYLAVHPDHHRKGIATMLVESGAKVAADLGLDIVAIAMGKSAHDLCLKLGFEQLEHESQDLSTYGEEGVYDTYYLLKRATKEVKASDSEP